MSTTEFEPSLLGTKEHWDQRYSQELTNFNESGLEGEVWFGEEPVEKMIEWAKRQVPSSTRPNILDVGTGNGHLLFALVDAGYGASRLTGIDYSQGSIDLSNAIAHHRDARDDGTEPHTHTHPYPKTYADITFAVCDFLDPASPVPLPKGEGGTDAAWDLVLDKGTWDAISLMDKDRQGRAPLELYLPRVVRLLRPDGHFLITSCNFTEDELIRQIAPQGGDLEFRSNIPYKKFVFGGKSGSSHVTIAFRKRSPPSD